MFEQIKKDLPNFPDEIIKGWLEPYAKEIGWPPTHYRWHGIFFGKTLEFWKTVSWDKQLLNITEAPMSKDTNEGLYGMREAFVIGKENIYSRNIEHGKERHDRALRHLVEHGRFPKPICLLKEQGVYSVVDGNHRILAWKTHWDIMTILPKAPAEHREKLLDTFRRKWKVDKLADFSPEQEVWIATKLQA